MRSGELRRESAPPLGARYHRLWAATAISNLGNGVLYAAMPLLAQTITTSPTQFSAVTASTALPGLLVALHAGAIVDRLDRRRVMIAMDFARLAVLVVFSIVLLVAHVPLWLLYLSAFLLGAGDVTFDGAARSLVPSLVPMERLDAANGRLAAATDTMDELLGPPTGVALFAIATAAPFIFDAATFGLSAVLLATIAGTFRAERDTRHHDGDASFRREIAEGLRFVRESRVLRVLSGTTGMLAFFSSANLAVLLLFVTETIGLPRAGWGYLLMTIAIGGVLGSLAVEWFTRRFEPVTVFAGAVAVNGAAYLLLSTATEPIVATIAAVAWGAGVSTGLTVSMGLRQALTPDHLLGRVMSVFRVLVGLGGVVGAILGGVLADAIHLRAPYVCSGIVQLVMTPVIVVTLRRAHAATD
jgi:MFS family permease